MAKLRIRHESGLSRSASSVVVADMKQQTSHSTRFNAFVLNRGKNNTSPTSGVDVH